MVNQANGPFEMAYRDSWRPELLIGSTAENNPETIESKRVFQSMLLQEIISKWIIVIWLINFSKKDSLNISNGYIIGISEMAADGEMKI